jgi:hypothetical protein
MPQLDHVVLEEELATSLDAAEDEKPELIRAAHARTLGRAAPRGAAMPGS